MLGSHCRSDQLDQLDRQNSPIKPDQSSAHSIYTTSSRPLVDRTRPLLEHSRPFTIANPDHLPDLHSIIPTYTRALHDRYPTISTSTRSLLDLHPTRSSWSYSVVEGREWSCTENLSLCFSSGCGLLSFLWHLWKLYLSSCDCRFRCKAANESADCNYSHILLPWSGELVLGRVAIENGRVWSSIGRLDRVNRSSSVRVDRDAVGNRSSRSRGDRVQVG